MKALILAGGAGTRLRPITHTGAKQLVPVANKPILFYGLEAMAEAGIVEVGLIVGDTAEEMRAAVGDGSRFGLEVTYIPQTAPLGLAHCVLIAQEFLGDDSFVMYLGDNLLREGIADLVEGFEKLDGEAAAQILLARVPDPRQFGVAELDDTGQVVRLLEKPDDPPSDLALVGVYLFDTRIHDAVRAIEPSARGELEITDAIQWLIDAGHRVRSQILDGWWKDTGNLEALLEGNRLILETIEPRIEGLVDGESRIEGRVVIQPGAEIVRSIVRGPSIIGEGTRIVDSYIGPFTSVYYGCHVARSEVEYSIVLEESRIHDVRRIADSLIGKQVEVSRTERGPRVVRLMLGDHSRVDLV
ncbi:MAG TPA: glucose-1-phosphate thymidylyltransferase [Acidimicrobiales bacterium]|nr:glucose-1-phosphate thymidylyltransferase [Acidimicrobiales bacterium]